MHLPVDAEGQLGGLHDEADGQQGGAAPDHPAGQQEELGQVLHGPGGEGCGRAEHTDAHKDEAGAQHVEEEVLEGFAQRCLVAFVGDGHVERPRAHDLPEQEELEEVGAGGHAHQTAAHGGEGAVEAPLGVAVGHVALGVEDVQGADERHDEGEAVAQGI